MESTQEKLIKKEVGLWIDHRKAVIVTIAHQEEGLRRIQSNLERQVRFSGDSCLEGSPEALRDSRIPNHQSGYYDDVIDCIRDAHSIQIFGPGEAKLQLEKRLRREELGGRIVGIETAEKMTERQIEAKVWQHFLSHA